MKSIKDDLNSVKRELTSLNETVSHLSGDLEQHKNQTASVLADLQSSINRSSAVTEELRETVVHNSAVYTCDGTGGWRRAVYLDMTDPNTNCPEGWNMTDYSKRTCGRATDGQHTCDSVTFSVSGGEYSQVCGRIRAYQFVYTTGFWGYNSGYTLVNDSYFSGVAVMHGSPQQHIWSFVAGVLENYTGGEYWLCPCDTTLSIPIPPFVGEDYFCESGYIYPGQWVFDEIEQFHSNDILWDGRDCHSNSTCCSLHNPPYFTKTLNTSTTDDIELRMCNYFDTQYGNTAVELVELYVR